MRRSIIAFIILVFGMCPTHANADNSRDLAVQNALDCISQHENNHELSGVTWADICSMPDTSQQFNLPQAITSAFHDRVNTFSLSAQAFYGHYSEPEQARTLRGAWEGVEGKYIYRPSEGNYLYSPYFFNYYAIEGMYARGLDDNTQNEQRFDYSWLKMVRKNIPGYSFEGRTLFGKSFIPLPDLRLTPYTGFGIRYRTDQFAGHYDQIDTNGPIVVLGYNFSDLYYYIPTGLTIDLAATNDYEVSLNLEYDYLVKGYERDEYANWDQFAIPIGVYPNSNIRYSLDHGWGARTSLKLLKHFSLVDVYIEPYARYWHINASKVASGYIGGLPATFNANKNATFELGSSLGVEF